jgi:hypothetical protein
MSRLTVEGADADESLLSRDDLGHLHLIHSVMMYRQTLFDAPLLSIIPKVDC